MNSSETLVQISDHILNSLNSLNKLEYSKNGRKYKFVNNGFQRIKQEDKHLVINVDDLSMKSAIISSYSILSNISNGELIEEYPEFCLCIIGVARQLELNGWYESSNVINYTPAINYSDQLKKDAINFSLKITDDHITKGFNLLASSKINFFHTDHHLGTKIYGFYLIKYMKDYFGPDSINDGNILLALKSFFHWGNIKMVLYKLEMSNIKLSQTERESYENAPDLPEELKEEIWSKYPSGTSKYSLIRKSLDLIADFEFASLIEYPQSEDLDLFWLYNLCHEIESNPVVYHLRSQSKNLTHDAVNLNELSNKYNKQIKALLSLISIIITTFELNYEFLNKNSKIPGFNSIKGDYQDLINSYSNTASKIQNYKSKGWSDDDIILRLKSSVSSSLFDKVMAMREQFIDDYE